jgi:hypothetical protein
MCLEHTHIYETDLKSYYPSIQKALLFERLGWDGIPESICRLIDPFMISPPQSKNVSRHHYKRFWPRRYGVYQGTTIAPYLAGCFLRDIDEKMSQEFPGYIRYVDDIIVLTDSQLQSDQAEKLLSEMLDRVKVKYYKSGDPKARNGSTDTGFLFLGIQFSKDGTRRIPKSKDNYFSNHLSELIDRGESFDLAFLKAGTFLQTWFSYYSRLLGCKHDYDDYTLELQLRLIKKITSSTSISKDQAIEFIDMLNCKRFKEMKDDVRNIDTSFILDGHDGTDLNQIALIN